MVLCHSMNADWVVSTPKGGGDTQTLAAVMNLLECYALTGGGNAKTSAHTCLRPSLPSHLVKLSLPNF